jgi:LPS-assembly lipoprotein
MIGSIGPLARRRHFVRTIVTMLSALGLGALLSGCGFQLRGATNLPPGVETVSISRGPTGLKNALTISLEGGGARIVERDADLRIRVFEARFTERLLSVDPNTGKPREFELAYRVHYEATDRSGNEVVPETSIRLIRDYVFDREAVIGKSRERGVLQREMQRDAADQIVRNLGRNRT